jgi:hypothetical protein
MRGVDSQASALLERAENAAGEELLGLHGTLRDLHFAGRDP